MKLQTLLLVLLVGASFPAARAAEPITVAALKSILANPEPLPAEFRNGGAPAALLQDSSAARHLDTLRLSERLTSVTLARLLKEYALGPETTRALTLLAYRSALLDPPADEFPKLPPPTQQQQQQMLKAARVYVFKMLSHLPDFFATRTTSQFYGVPPELNETGLPVRVGLYPRGSVSHEITFRGGREVIDPMAPARPAESLAEPGLESWGEFGPEPAVILLDSASGTIAFHHWEQTPSGLAAVYRYSVPEAKSNYEVNYGCPGSTAFHAQPAYHGTLAIAPDSGAILRLSLQADWKKGDPISHVASVIDYGPEDIGGHSYICPVRSLAFSVEDSNVCHRDSYNRSRVQPMTINRTTFTHYHLLASTHKFFTGPVSDPPATRQQPMTQGPHQ